MTKPDGYVSFTYSSLKAIAEVLHFKAKTIPQLDKFGDMLSKNLSLRMLKRLSKIDYVPGSFGSKIDCSEFKKSEIETLDKFLHNKL